jgi:preprotein translocase subunit SecG
MEVLKAFLIIIEVLSSILLIVVILLQKSKGEGLGMAFGAEMGEALFGARAGNILIKATIWLGVVFLLNTAVLAKIYTRSQYRSLVSSGVSERVEDNAPPPQPGGSAEESVPYP